jgi:hypothetical protein
MPAKTAVVLGPADHGRRMSLADFDSAEALPGRIYELGRGGVVVVDVPNPRHLAQCSAARRLFAAFDLANPGVIHTIAGGGECKILVTELESERHPDLAVYKTPPPRDDSAVWAEWVPEIVVEVVSPGAEDRDYVEKRDEYLRFGVLEYWILDHARREMTALRRRGGAWAAQVVRPPETYRTPLLRGLEFSVAAVFASADQV